MLEREPSACLSAFPGLFCHQGIRLFVCVRGTKEEKGKDPILAIPALSHNAATSIWRVSALEEFKEYCFKVNTISDACRIHYINSSLCSKPDGETLHLYFGLLNLENLPQQCTKG